MSTEQLGMTANSNKFYRIGRFVNPYQKKVALNMALHVPDVITIQHMCTVFLRNGLICL